MFVTDIDGSYRYSHLYENTGSGTFFYSCHSIASGVNHYDEGGVWTGDVDSDVRLLCRGLLGCVCVCLSVCLSVPPPPHLLVTALRFCVQGKLDIVVMDSSVSRGEPMQLSWRRNSGGSGCSAFGSKSLFASIDGHSMYGDATTVVDLVSANLRCRCARCAQHCIGLTVRWVVAVCVCSSRTATATRTS